MPVPDDESSDDDEEDIFARPVEAVEAVWSDDDDETRRSATSPRARDFTLGTPAGTRIAFATDDGSEGEVERVHGGGHAVGDVGNGSTSGVGGEDETTAKRRRVSRRRRATGGGGGGGRRPTGRGPRGRGGKRGGWV